MRTRRPCSGIRDETPPPTTGESFSVAPIVKVLVFTTIFPSAAQPVHGLFVAERTRHASRLAAIRVISPIAWFRGPKRPLGDLEPLHVEHPTWFYLPGLFKCLDGILLFLSALPSVARLRRSFDFEVIDAHFGFPDGVAAVLLGAWFRRPVVVTLRGSELVKARYKLRRRALAWALRRADRIIAVSPELAALAIALGAAPGHVSVIGNGVDAQRFQPMDRAEARRRLGLPESAPLVVSVGHLARVKGFDVVIRAVPGIAAVHPSVRFVIVGGPAASSGRYPAELADEIARLGIANHVTITGAVPPEQVALWLNAADMFVLASEREGSPNALREALACGCPVVACNAGDALQILGPHAGIIVADRTSAAEWRDAVLAALGRPWDRATIRADAERHTWAGVAARVTAEWQACLGVDAAAESVKARASAR
jgi:glycosyltransferase involved in cell wall biosynthesis